MCIETVKAIPRPKALFEAIADSLRSRMLSHELPPGAAIDETLVARELGVSRTPVREAIKVLARDGLVTVTHRGSTYCNVTNFSAYELADLLKVTEYLETFYQEWEENPFVEELLQRVTEKLYLALGPAFIRVDVDAKRGLKVGRENGGPTAKNAKKALSDYFAWRRLEVAKLTI